MANLWSDEGTWIALGVTLITVVMAVVMHRVIVQVLKSGPPERSPDSPPEKSPHE